MQNLNPHLMDFIIFPAISDTDSTRAQYAAASGRAFNVLINQTTTQWSALIGNKHVFIGKKRRSATVSRVQYQIVDFVYYYHRIGRSETREYVS